MKIFRFTYIFILILFVLSIGIIRCADEPEYPGEPLFDDTEAITFVSPSTDGGSAGTAIEWKEKDDVKYAVFIFNQHASISNGPEVNSTNETFDDDTFAQLTAGADWDSSGMSEGSIAVSDLKTVDSNYLFTETNNTSLSGGTFWIVIVGFSNTQITYSSPKWEVDFP